MARKQKSLKNVKSGDWVRFSAVEYFPDGEGTYTRREVAFNETLKIPESEMKRVKAAHEAEMAALVKALQKPV